ncbi:unnamed protein product [Trifolium pratense]|uniref:Uncharacterized protein n=1 Tax=Trifolium pratense TaxID=57577 RepID=A0ACB0IXH9_TRIPR|nr:unnamed protein product [Trifolium pratense]
MLLLKSWRKFMLKFLLLNQYGSMEIIEYFLLAVIDPNKPALEAWAGKNDMKMEFGSLCEDSRTKSYILGELVKIAKEKKLKDFEFIKVVHIDPVTFDMERDLIAPTFKKKIP